MRDRKKRNITIISLCCLLVFMAVGYAVLSQALNINGTANLTGEWKVYIDSITEIAEGNTTSGKSITAEVTGEEKTDAYFEAELIKPGDYVEYKVIVKNEGNIDASLRELVTSSSYEHPDVKFNHTLEQGTVLKGGDEKEFTVKVEFLRSATEIPEETVLDYTMRIVYEQFDGNTITTPPNIETDNSCFTVSADGTLEGYDYNCGLDVTVPASVNGINITKITKDSFMPTDTQAQEMGYGRYYNFRVYHYPEGSDIEYFIAEDDFSYNKLLEHHKISSKQDLFKSMQSNFVFKKSSLSDLYIYSYSGIMLFTSDGKYVDGIEVDYEQAEHQIYIYFTPEEFYVAEDQTGYEAMLKYAASNGIDSSKIYLDGDPNIPKSDYKIKFTSISENQNDDFVVDSIITFYTNGSKAIDGFTNLITTLDLSNSKYLESISTYSQFDNLTKLVLPENGNLTTIGNSTFSGSKLTKVVIPSTVLRIGDYAFSSSTLVYIRINRKSSEGITFGTNWKSNNAVVKYIGK